jgi:hypothetical protein
VPDDQRASDEDATAGPGQSPSPGATADEATVACEGTGVEGGAQTSAPQSGETSSSRGAPGEEASAEPDGGEGAAAATEQREHPKLPAVGSPNFDEHMRAFAHARDAEDNVRTRPPNDETVTFRSITLAEVYIGKQADSLATALRAIEWVDFPRKIAEDITQARKDDRYAIDNFTFLFAPDPTQALFGHGEIGLPAGCKRIYGRYYVLGPSIVVLVLTFVLSDAEARRLDAVLRNDVKASVIQSGSAGTSVKSVYQVKYELVHRLWSELANRCLAWLGEKLPGTLVTGSDLSVPSCSLVSLVKGRPFETKAEYMRLLELTKGSVGFRFGRPDFMYLTPSIGLARGQQYIAAFNEADALASGSYPSLSVTPEILHDEIAPFMIKEALEGVFRSFESRMRGIRSGLEKIDFDGTPRPLTPIARFLSWLGFRSATDSLIVELRNRLLGLSRDLAIAVGDVAVFVDTGNVIWRDYPWLHSVPKQYGNDRENPADVAREDLRSLMAKVQAQETGLRELVIVTSQAVSDVQNTETTKRLNVLTIVLVFLTIGLVFIGIVQLVDPPSAGTNSPSVTPHTSAPATRHPLSPTPNSVTSTSSAKGHGQSKN